MVALASCNTLKFPKDEPADLSADSEDRPAPKFHRNVGGAPSKSVSSGEEVEFSTAAQIVDRRKKLRAKFNRFADAWRKERNSLSSRPEELAMCMSYQKIIGMGQEVVPFILQELRRKPDQWFWALHAITDANPVSRQHQGRFTEMVNAWLKWGEDHGFILS